MSESKPTALWAELYRKAGFIQETAPWTFLAESDVFGLVDEVSGKCVYVQAMGDLGEHAAVSLYLGDESFVEMLQALNSPDDPDEMAQRIADIAQLQFVFDRPTGIAPDERKWLKRHGVDQPGKGVRPLVRRFGWGLVPFVLLDVELGEMLLRLSPRLISVFEAVRGGQTIPEINFDQLAVPFLDTVASTGELAWKMIPTDLGQAEEASPLADEVALAEIAAMKPGGPVVDLLLMRGGDPVLELKQTPPEPYFPLVMVAVDRQNGMMTPPVFLAHPLADPLPTLAQRAFAELARENFDKRPRHVTLWPLSFGLALKNLLEEAGVERVDVSSKIVPEDWCEMANMFPAYLPSDYLLDEDGGEDEDDREDDESDERSEMFAEDWAALSPIASAVAERHFPEKTRELFLDLCDNLVYALLAYEDVRLAAWTPRGVERMLLESVAVNQIGSLRFFEKSCEALVDLMRELGEADVVPAGDEIAEKMKRISRRFVQMSTDEQSGSWGREKVLAKQAEKSGDLDPDDSEAVDDFLDDLDDDDDDVDFDDEWDVDDGGPPAPLPFMPQFDR